MNEIFIIVKLTTMCNTWNMDYTTSGALYTPEIMNTINQIYIISVLSNAIKSTSLPV